MIFAYIAVSLKGIFALSKELAQLSAACASADDDDDDYDLRL